MKKPRDLYSFVGLGQKLFDVQPASCREPLTLPTKGVNWKHIHKRVFFFDPTSVYERINELNLLNPYQRHCSVSMMHLFHNIENKCACGCNQELSGRQKRWASKECSVFAVYVFDIIAGRQQTLRKLRSLFVGGLHCEVCGIQGYDVSLELDHIIPVKHGGGGGWLSNYQFKCKKCHREKTNMDFGFKQSKNLKLF